MTKVKNVPSRALYAGILLAALAALAVLAIVGIQTIGAQGGPAAEPGYTVTFRALTEAEWTELDPLTAASGAAVTEWTDDDQLLPQGSLRVTWTTPPGAPPALKFHVDRRFHYSGNESEWTRVKSNNKGNSYTDITGAPWFSYSYRITPIHADGTGTPFPTPEHTFYQRGEVSGFGSKAGVTLRFAVNNPDNDWLQLSRFDSPSDTVATMTWDESLPESTPDGIVDDTTVAGTIYKYVAEFGTKSGGEFTSGSTEQVIIMAGAPTLDSPEMLTVAANAAGSGAQLGWTRPTATHESEIATYLVLRRNWREYQSEYKVIGTAKDTSWEDRSHRSTQHYAYRIMLVGYTEGASGRSPRLIEPPLPFPTCTGSNGDRFESGDVRMVDITDFSVVPHDSEYVFGLWLVPTFTGSTAAQCLNADPTDWYVQRKLKNLHGLSDACPDPTVSCNVVTSSERLDGTSTEWEEAPGEWKTMTMTVFSTRTKTFLNWHQDTPDDIGVYNWKYKVCSYAVSSGQAAKCSSDVGLGWRFEGVVSQPFNAP